MKLSISEIRQTLETIIRSKSSLDDEEIRILADTYLEGELQGKLSHGLLGFRDLVPKLTDTTGNFELLKETAAFVYVDAHGSFGALVGPKVVELVAIKAAKLGIGVGFIRDMKSWLRPAAIAQQLAERHLVGFVVNDGGAPSMVPPGGRELVVGTNPIGIGLPTDGDPQVVDMATSVHAWGEVRKAKRLGTTLPDKAYVDESGQVTTNPDAAFGTLPMGGYKGFALALLIEVLGGSFVDMPMGGGGDTSNISNMSRNRGAMILALDPAITVGRDKFEAANSDFFNRLRVSTPVEGRGPITLPGDRARSNRTAAVAAGSIEVNDQLWSDIQSMLQREAK